MQKPNPSLQQAPDALARLFETENWEAQAAAPAAPPDIDKQPTTAEPKFSEACPKCRGSGRYGSLGACFHCKGKGKLEFKRPAEVRAKARASTKAREARVAADAAAIFAAEHPQVMAWITANGAPGGFAFAGAMAIAIAKYGFLTEGQIAAVHRCIEADKVRAERIAAERAALAARGVDCDVSKIERAFALAAENGIERPKLRLGAFMFKPARAFSRNEGAIYVTAGSVYLGMVKDGRFAPRRECSDEQRRQIVEICADPAKAATADAFRQIVAGLAKKRIA